MGLLHLGGLRFLRIRVPKARGGLLLEGISVDRIVHHHLWRFLHDLHLLSEFLFLFLFHFLYRFLLGGHSLQFLG